MIEHLPNALASLQTALTLGKSLFELSNVVKSQDKLIEFNSAIISAQQLIISAQQEHTKLLKEIDLLKAKNDELQKWNDDRSQYSKIEIAFGIFAYVEKNYEGKLMNVPKYCCNCFENRKTSTLQQFYIEVGRKTGLKCSNGCPDLTFYSYRDH